MLEEILQNYFSTRPIQQLFQSFQLYHTIVPQQMELTWRDAAADFDFSISSGHFESL